MSVIRGGYTKRGQKMAWDALEVQLRTVVSHVMWVPGTQLRPSKAQHYLHTEPSLQPYRLFLCHALLTVLSKKNSRV